MTISVIDDPTWRPDPAKDSRFYIWKVLFKVNIPVIDTYSPQWIEKFGVRVSGNEEYDEIMKHEIISTYKSIDAMVEIFRRGGRIGVTPVTDCIKIYHYIDNHLEMWARFLENSPFNRREPPIDDLLLLDEFAALCFEYARWDMANTDALSFLRRQHGVQYKHTVAALQEAIPTIASIRNKQNNAIYDKLNAGIRMVEQDEVTAGFDRFDAFTYKRDKGQQTMEMIERNLPKRHSYAALFEQYRTDQSISTLAPSMEERFKAPSASAESLFNRLGANAK